MSSEQQHLEELQDYEREYERIRNLFLEDDEIDDAEQQQLDRIEQLIQKISEQLNRGNAAASHSDEATSSAASAPAGLASDDEPAVDDRRKEFQKARRSWQAVKEKAIQDLEAVKDGIRDYYLDDADQFKLATSKLDRLDGIMDNLNDDLRDVLDRYVATSIKKQTELQRLGDEATSIVKKFLDYVSNDRLLNAVDQKEFANVTVKAPIEKALKALVKTLA